jgi:hypothetical protein
MKDAGFLWRSPGKGKMNGKKNGRGSLLLNDINFNIQ